MEGSKMKPEITVFTSINPDLLTKKFSLQDGALHKEGGGLLVEGKAEVRAFNDLADLKSILLKLKTNQALSYGLPIRSPVRILSKAKWIREGCPESAIPRDKEHFKWPDGPGVMMIDYDAPTDGPVLTCTELLGVIHEAVPPLRDVVMLWWPSASSYIANADTGEGLRNLQGQRLYMLVENASDIPRAGKALVEYLWASGYGHIQISKSGDMLDRTAVDGSVWQPNRFDFAAGAACQPPLHQNRGEPELISGSVEIADTAVLILSPDPIILAKADAERKKHRKSKYGEAKAARDQWVEERVATMVSFDASDKEKADSREAVLRAVEHNSLSGNFILFVVENNETVEVTVSDVLDDIKRFDGLQTYDPIEPDYDGGRVIGKLYLVGSQPTLNSFAHGGSVYKLYRHIEHVELIKGRTRDAVLATLELLKNTPDVFDFGGALVAVESGRIHPLDALSLMHHLGGAIQYWRWVKSSGGSFQELADPPEKLVRQIIALGDRRNLKYLKAVVTGPTLRPDGTVMDTPGYDAETGLLFETRENVVPVPEHPNEDQVETALKTLLKPFVHFPTVGALDRGILLASLLTAASRPAFKTSPAFGFDAPAQASGKTLLASSVGALATGDHPTVWPHTAGRDDEETRKRLFVALRNGTRALVWDNVVGTFNSAAMSTALTSSNLTDRVLGKSESVCVPNRAIIILTGNNLTLGGDLGRRVLKCRIDAKTERPYARTFDFDPLELVLKNRQALLSAALTIIRGFISNKIDRDPGRMASFEEWDDYVRQTVIWIGRDIIPGEFDDPMNAVIEAQSSDPEQEILGELLQALHDMFSGEFVSAIEIYKSAIDRMGCDKAARLEEVLNEIKGPSKGLNSRGVGRLLSYRADRIVQGLRLEARKDKSAGSMLWGVVEVKDK
jgi:hypothetical protein